MTPDVSLSTILLAVGFVLVVAPATMPLDPVLAHETRESTLQNRSALEAEGITVIAYENLSERGQELYVQTLENGGRYTVPNGTGAADFAYPTTAELRGSQDYRERARLEAVVIERPADANLPPADERTERAERIAAELEDGEEHQRNTQFSNMSEDEIRRQIARYDAMTTGTERPALTATPALARFGAAAVGVLSVGLGGYFASRP